MGLIVRTAGLSRTKVEIKRDFDYLARLWDEIRERTLGSTAPALIYRDSDLIKRAIRDLYHREIDEVIVEGEEGYKAARGFMKLLMPSHVRRVKLHSRDHAACSSATASRTSFSAMYQPIVQLKSGGYLVINPTEALVSIDINSGRSTREHNIEQTAFSTNLEAAAEIARQLRLRDMAGLIVIDFIDMEQSSHVRKVEKAMKEALKNDRARIQVGRISSFGLMEMSRQRLSTGVLEASTKPCPHCEGTGLMRTAASAGLSALRMIEDEATRGRGEKILLRAGREAAVYVLNKKRAELADIEQRYGVSIEIADRRELRRRADERSKAPVRGRSRRRALEARDRRGAEDEDEFEDETALEDEEEPKRRRPRRERRGSAQPRASARAVGGAAAAAAAVAVAATVPRDEAAPAHEEAVAAEAETEVRGAGGRVRCRSKSRRRRRGRGRRKRDRSRRGCGGRARQLANGRAADRRGAADRRDRGGQRSRSRSAAARKKAVAEAEVTVAEPAPAEAPPAETADQAAPPAKPARKRRTKAAAGRSRKRLLPSRSRVPAANNDTAEEDDSGEPRRGWWQRTFG